MGQNLVDLGRQIHVIILGGEGFLTCMAVGLSKDRAS